jgi:hypothetical protein
VLQVLFVQQDAVQHLAEALSIPYEPDSALSDIREIRNDSTGHPTKRGGGAGRAFNSISRFSMSPGGYELMTSTEEGDTIRHINVMEMVATQRLHVAAALESIINKLDKQEQQYRDEFKGEALPAAVNPAGEHISVILLLSQHS